MGRPAVLGDPLVDHLKQLWEIRIRILNSIPLGPLLGKVFALETEGKWLTALHGVSDALLQIVEPFQGTFIAGVRSGRRGAIHLKCGRRRPEYPGFIPEFAPLRFAGDGAGG